MYSLDNKSFDKVKAAYRDLEQRQGTPTATPKYPRAVGGGRWGSAFVGTFFGGVSDGIWTFHSGGTLTSPGEQAFGITGWDGLTLTWDSTKSNFTSGDLLFQVSLGMAIPINGQSLNCDFHYTFSIWVETPILPFTPMMTVAADEFFRGDAPNNFQVNRNFSGWGIYTCDTSWAKFRLGIIGDNGSPLPNQIGTGGFMSVTPLVGRAFA